LKLGDHVGQPAMHGRPNGASSIEAAEPVELNFAAICAAIEDAVPEREAIVWRDRAWTWRQTGDRSRRLARALHDAGFGIHGALRELAPWESPHDHVALYLHNGNEYLEGMLGAYAARCAPVNVNYRYRAAELRHVLADSRARVVIFHGSFAATLAEVRGDLPDLAVLVQVDDASGVPLLDGAVGYEAWLEATRPELPASLVDSWSGDDLYVCYTGGTTGSPKGVLWRQDDFLAAALGIGRLGGREVERLDQLADAALRSTLRALPAPPLMHGAAHWNAMSCWAAGGAVVMQDDTTRLDPADVWRAVARHRATSLLIVGDPFARPLLDEWDRAVAAGAAYDVASLRHVLSGGAVLSPAVRQGVLDRLGDVTVVDVLGSTESGRQGVAHHRGRAEPNDGFTGAPTSVVLDDDLRSRLGPGDERTGWLAQTGRVPRGYLGDPDKTARTFPVVDGVHTAIAGDRARVRSDGSIELLGRDSATINTGGEKVFAEEVETVLTAHPSIFDAVVCGRPSERWGQEVVAVAQLRAGSEVDDDELRSWCRARLADFKAPKAIVRVERVERSPSGKPDYRWAVRKALDAQARSG
jgi:fatty-acyl-CoA synthase